MSKPSHILPPTAPPLLAIVAGEKGGVGKSLTSLVLADLFELHALPLNVLQIDNQARLSRALGREVTTIRVDAKLARRDPAAAARAYTPIYEAAAQAGGGMDSHSVLVDVGANEAGGFAQWLDLVELADDLSQWTVPSLLIVPYVAEGEAIRQAGQTARRLLESLPSAQLVLVENERDGRIADLHPASDAAQAWQTAIAPLRREAHLITMPLIEAGSWRPFEAAGCRLIDVAGMAVGDAMRLTGLPRPEAKIARGDVAAFVAQMMDSFASVVAFPKATRS